MRFRLLLSALVALSAMHAAYAVPSPQVSAGLPVSNVGAGTYGDYAWSFQAPISDPPATITFEIPSDATFQISSDQKLPFNWTTISAKQAKCVIQLYGGGMSIIRMYGSYVKPFNEFKIFTAGGLVSIYSTVTTTGTSATCPP